MNTSAIASLVRGWVDFYTRGLPADVRAARRDEVADDLWCQHEEAALKGRSSSSLNVEMFTRWLLGVPADLSWRLSHPGGAGAPAPERKSSAATRVIGGLAIIGGASWLSAAVIGSSGEGGDLWVFSVSGAVRTMSLPPSLCACEPWYAGTSRVSGMEVVPLLVPLFLEAPLWRPPLFPFDRDGFAEWGGVEFIKPFSRFGATRLLIVSSWYQ